MKIRVQLGTEQLYEIAKMMQKTKSRVEALRCRVILLLADGMSPCEVEERVGCVRSTVYTTLYRFEDEGVDGLRDKRLYAPARKATPEVREQLLAYLEKVPKDYQWQRSSWTLELLSLQLNKDAGVSISVSHLRQVLKQEKCRRGRPRPALRIPVRGRREILGNIEHLAQRASCDEEVVYVDEADVDLNPRIGLTYMKPGQQYLVLTPGTNVKYYIAGALNTRTGRIIYSHGTRKDSVLFIDLLRVLNNAYPRARRIHVVLDNYVIHKSRVTHKALEALPRVQLHFLPPYSPEHNPIERLWKQMHDNITRNHRHPTMQSLWKDITRFLEDVQPFPGTKISLQRAAA